MKHNKSETAKEDTRVEVNISGEDKNQNVNANEKVDNENSNQVDNQPGDNTGSEKGAKGVNGEGNESGPDKEACTELELVKKAMDDLKANYDKLNDTYLRTLAEYDNYRKRTLKEKADLIKTGGETVLVNVLTVVDDLERGINSSKNAQEISAVLEGMDLIKNKFYAFLKQNGIKEIEAVGADFDTDHHEAIATIPAPEESQKGKIIDCVQKGYYLHDKVIRFAKVVVGE